MYGSVPFSKDESYRPLRAPKVGPVHSTLSADAPEFVFPPPQQQYMNVQPQHQQYQQGPNPLDQSQPPQLQQPAHNQQYQHHFNNSHNGYPHTQHRNSHFQQQQQHHQQHHSHHHQQQQQQHYQPQHHHQQQQQHGQRMGALANDVQDRLKINNHSGNNRQSSYNYNSQGHHHRSNNSYQNHHNRSNNSYQNQSQQSRLKYNNLPSTSSSAAEEAAGSNSDMESIALDYLTSVIQCLNSNPGQYDTVATRFLNIFEGLENNQYVLSIAMEEIFNESTKNPNFRYMGAKLYHLLHMLNLKKDSLFLTLLKCKLDDFQREVREYMDQSQHGKVREATLFLAELYMQLRGDDNRIRLLAENIVFSLRQLLGSESPDNMRCICLTLKLAGYDLTNDCKQEIAEIISCLQSVNERSPGKYAIIASVLALSKENWGRKLSSSASFSEPECMPAPLRSSDEPIFYGPDGRELTTEETDFLTGGLLSGPSGSTDDDDDADLDEFDLEMDEEASKAYKEFCKQSASS